MQSWSGRNICAGEQSSNGVRDAFLDLLYSRKEEPMNYPMDLLKSLYWY